MTVTWTIRFKGSYREATVLGQMLEDQGVLVELSPKGRRRLERAQRRAQKWQVLLQRAELLEWHDREKRELLQRLAQEPRELREQRRWQLHDMDRRHDRERVEMGMAPRGSDAEPAPLVSLRQMFRADFDQVGISLWSTGAASAVAKAVQEFREVAAGCEVEVQEESHSAIAAPLVSLRQMFRADFDQVGISLWSTGAPTAITQTVKTSQEAVQRSEVEDQTAPLTAIDDNPSPPQAHSTLPPPGPPANARCTATTRAGTRCKLEAGSDGLCPVHRPRGPQVRAT